MARNILIYLAVITGIVAFSALFILVFGKSIEVRCIREVGSEPACRITRRLLGQMTISDRDVVGVTGVQMDETCDDGCSYRAVLVTSSGDSAPVNDVYTDSGIVLLQITALEGFLGGTAPSFEYVEPVPWWVGGIILAMDLIGLVSVAGSFLRRSRTGQP